MGQPAAKRGDHIVATDMHLIQPPGPTAPVLVPHPFNGLFTTSLSSNVNIMGQSAATVGSIADNTPPHIPIGGTFVIPPRNKGQVIQGSATVFINGKPVARNGDTALTCNDPVDQPVGRVVAVGTVNAG